MAGFQWMLSFSVKKVSWGISAKNGKYVAIVLFIYLRLCCCLMVRLSEKLIIGK